MFAARKSLPMVKLLIENGMDIFAKDTLNHDALWYAKNSKKLDIQSYFELQHLSYYVTLGDLATQMEELTKILKKCKS